jgi:hypothetical protein
MRAAQTLAWAGDQQSKAALEPPAESDAANGASWTVYGTVRDSDEFTTS